MKIIKEYQPEENILLITLPTKSLFFVTRNHLMLWASGCHWSFAEFIFRMNPTGRFWTLLETWKAEPNDRRNNQFGVSIHDYKNNIKFLYHKINILHHPDSWIQVNIKPTVLINRYFLSADYEYFIRSRIGSVSGPRRTILSHVRTHFNCRFTPTIIHSSIRSDFLVENT